VGVLVREAMRVKWFGEKALAVERTGRRQRETVGS
jgi:hypothetical protein